MANPFLVLGGIAITVVTAAFGVLQVPGWVASAQDASAINDVSQVVLAQAAQVSSTGAASSSIDTVGGAGVEVSLGGKTVTATDSTGEHYLVAARSASGAYFARTSDTATIGRGDTIEGALAQAGAAVTSRGVPVTAAPGSPPVGSRCRRPASSRSCGTRTCSETPT